MRLPQTETEYIHALRHAAEVSNVQTLISVGMISATVSKSEAFKMYGRANVEKWYKAGLLPSTQKNGLNNSTWSIDRIELETVSKAKNIRHLLI